MRSVFGRLAHNHNGAPLPDSKNWFIFKTEQDAKHFQKEVDKYIAVDNKGGKSKLIKRGQE